MNVAVKYVAGLTHNQYRNLMVYCWLTTTLILIIAGVYHPLSFFIGAIMQYPAHLILGRIEFGRWSIK